MGSHGVLFKKLKKTREYEGKWKKLDNQDSEYLLRNNEHDTSASNTLFVRDDAMKIRIT